MAGEPPIASQWPTRSLKDVTSKIGAGATPRGGSDSYLATRTTYALVRSQNVFDRRFSTENLAFISDAQAAGLQNVLLQKGDVLLNITGDGVTFARACMIPEEIRPACVNQHVSIVRTEPNLADAGYVLAYLTHPDVKSYIESFNAGGSRRAITKGHIESFQIPLPPLDVQRAIANILGSLDDKIDLNRRMNETLEEMARALFKSWFVDFDPVRAKAAGRKPSGMDAETAKLFPSEFEESELGEIPKGWSVGCIGELIEIHDSKRIPLSKREREARKGQYPYYGAASVVDYVDDYLFDGVYALLGEDGSVVDAEGFPFTQYVWGKFWVNNHAHVLTGTRGVSPEHVLLLLSRTPVAAFVTGAVQPKLSQGNLKRIPCVIAPDKVNAAFGASTSELFARIRANTEQSRTLAELRDALLPKLLSGELSVKSAERILEATA